MFPESLVGSSSSNKHKILFDGGRLIIIVLWFWVRAMLLFYNKSSQIEKTVVDGPLMPHNRRSKFCHWLSFSRFALLRSVTNFRYGDPEIEIVCSSHHFFLGHTDR